MPVVRKLSRGQQHGPRDLASAVQGSLSLVAYGTKILWDRHHLVCLELWCSLAVSSDISVYRTFVNLVLDLTQILGYLFQTSDFYPKV
jgi:FtsH-binding integral membrane protein